MQIIKTSDVKYGLISFQVLAYSLGLGPLINETRLAMHMKAELEKNDSPYGMLVMTGMTVI